MTSSARELPAAAARSRAAEEDSNLREQEINRGNYLIHKAERTVILEGNA